MFYTFINVLFASFSEIKWIDSIALTATIDITLQSARMVRFIIIFKFFSFSHLLFIIHDFDHFADSRITKTLTPSLGSQPFKLHNLETGPSTKAELSKDEAVEYYKQMQTIRRMETAAGNLYKEKIVRGFCHLYSGQEACAVGKLDYYSFNLLFVSIKLQMERERERAREK